MRKLTNRQKDGRKDGRTDRTYFIGPFRPRPGVQISGANGPGGEISIFGLRLEPYLKYPYYKYEALSTIYTLYKNLSALLVFPIKSEYKNNLILKNLSIHTWSVWCVDTKDGGCNSFRKQINMGIWLFSILLEVYLSLIW